MAHFAMPLHHAATRGPEAPAAPESQAAAFGLMVLCWLLASGVFIAGKWVNADFPPWALVFWRVLLACLFLLPFVLPHRQDMIAVLRKQFPAIVALGALGLGITQGMIFTGLAYTTATNAGLIFALSPIFTLVLASLVLGERLGAWQVAGSACAVGGMVVIICQGNPEALRSLSFNVGDLWILAAAFTFSLYTVFLKRSKFGLSTLQLLTLFLGAAAIATAPLFGWEILHDERVTLNWKGLLAIAYIAIPAGAFMYLLYNMGVQVLGAAKSGVTFYLQTVFTPLLGYLLLGEQLHAYHFVGIALIAAGVLLVALLKPKAQPQSSAAK